ncbi:copper-containing nitrite reductase [Pasteurella caecimuris]|uniref:copper-containing nitrite reductase n=1 Tax=Rodentibacter caecimuris TaxID=1796644 RepID=UPI0021503CAC|nr:copper-containing nitrite reductase [Pasteurella caecimuris]MCR1837472.1 copper-containing nitrite reductase [Pasteurella caecimuris]MCU0106892.1 copper-containing nitrite reductase [Pasteurella caecimuris]
MNEQRRDFLKNSTLSIATLTLGAGLIQMPPAQATEDNNSPISPEQPLPEIEAEITLAPEVPKPIERNYPAKVVVRLTALEKIMELMDGVQYKFWTFNGNVPAPFIRIREGDIVEVQLSNSASSMMPHSIDFHAAAVPMGGAIASETAPTRTGTFQFKALRSGIYLYHCGSQPVAVHLAKGMYGLILVEPKEGLPKVDREFYIMQSEFYTKGRFGESGLQPFSMSKAIDERPDYVLFNGKVGAMMGEKALKAKTGEKIRLFIGNAGPNLISSFHLIGAVFDNVYVEGGTLINHNVQTTLIPSGGATIVETQIDVSGTYVFMDHSMFRAANKGTMGQIIVTGEKNPSIYSGKLKDEPIKNDPNPQKPQPVPYEIDSHKEMTQHYHADMESGATKK